jgi:hypothetical protein
MLARITILLALMLFGTIIGARAQSANYRPAYPSTAWVKECLTPEQVKGDNINTCRAYIHGLINALAIWQVLSPQTAQVCISRDADFGKMRDQIMPQIKKKRETI